MLVGIITNPIMALLLDQAGYFNDSFFASMADNDFIANLDGFALMGDFIEGFFLSEGQ